MSVKTILKEALVPALVLGGAAFVLHPVTLAIFAVGFLGLALARRRGQKSGP